MDISKHMHDDHEELRSLGQDILKSGSGSDAGGRDNQFDRYETEVRRHLAVVEDVLLTPLAKDPASKGSASNITTEHQVLRNELKKLDRAEKGDPQWTSDFRNFVGRFDQLCQRHELLIRQSQSLGSAAELEQRYERAKLKRLQGYFSWNRVASGGVSTMAAVAGVAAAAGAAYAANRYFRSGRRASGKGQDDFELRLETDENLRLISSKKVEGTSVVDRDGAKIGTIQSFMVDKYTGRVAYAVMSFGGTMGFGASLFPLPWPLLDYEEDKDGYVLDITKQEMMDAPRFEAEKEPEFSPEYRRSILVFYRPQTDAGGAAGSSPSSRGAHSPAEDRPAIGTENSWGSGQSRSGAGEGVGSSSRPSPTSTAAG